MRHVEQKHARHRLQHPLGGIEATARAPGACALAACKGEAAAGTLPGCVFFCSWLTGLLGRAIERNLAQWRGWEGFCVVGGGCLCVAVLGENLVVVCTQVGIVAVRARWVDTRTWSQENKRKMCTTLDQLSCVYDTRSTWVPTGLPLGTTAGRWALRVPSIVRVLCMCFRHMGTRSMCVACVMAYRCV